MSGKSWVFIFVIAICVAGAIAFMLLIAMGSFLPDGRSFAFGDRVGLVEITGTMIDPDPVVNEIVRFAKDDDVRAIVVRIESPGGVVAAAQEIYTELARTRDEGKPIVASMGGIAASGGYYVACGATSIVANPGTLTGSIGVIMSFPHSEELFRKLGIGFDVIKTGEYKDLGSLSRPLTADEKQLMLELLNDVYDQFVTVVSLERDIEPDVVKEFADGRLLTGRQAYDLGLVDSLGGFREAVMLAGDLAGISGEPTLLRPRRRTLSWWDILEDILGRASEAARTCVSLEYSLN
ncbi:MAG: signal peptide peptidase SppA [Candidatus Eisenbacteria bacterium]